MILIERSIIQHTYCLYYNFKVRDFLLPSPIIMKEKKKLFCAYKKDLRTFFVSIYEYVQARINII